jgi:hypothetical protein
MKTKWTTHSTTSAFSLNTTPGPQQVTPTVTPRNPGWATCHQSPSTLVSQPHSSNRFTLLSQLPSSSDRKTRTAPTNALSPKNSTSANKPSTEDVHPSTRSFSQPMTQLKPPGPRSVHFYNLAQQFLATLEGANIPKPLDWDTLEKWAVRRNVQRNSAHTLWLAVISAAKDPHVTPAVIQKHDTHHPDVVDLRPTTQLGPTCFPNITKKALTAARSHIIKPLHPHLATLDSIRTIHPELLDVCFQRLKRTNKFAVIHIQEVEKLLADAHASSDPTQPPQADSAHGLFLAEAMQRTFTLLLLHFQDCPSIHWMLATVEVLPNSNTPHVSMWNSLPGRCFAKARYALHRLLQPLGATPTFSQPRSRR